VRKTLYGKLAAVLLLLLILIGVAYVYLTLFTTKRYIEEVTQKLHEQLAEKLVAERILVQGGEIDEEALENIFHWLMVVNPSIEVYLLSPEGKIRAFSAPPGTVKRESISLEPVERFMAGRNLPILGDDPRDWSRKKVFSVAPIPLEQDVSIRETSAASSRSVDGVPEIEGYLYIVLGGEEYDSAAEMFSGSFILKLSTGMASAGLVVTLLAGLMLFGLLTRRLRVLAGDMDRFRRSRYTERPDRSQWIPRDKGDEIDQLGSSFEQMSERIGEQMSELEEKDELRRTLVANVSHDLRTPLATLHGYLETMLLKEDSLGAEERRRYIETAARHSERLGNLISELFELSKLDSHEIELQIEPFSVTELVQDVVQDFQLKAKETGVLLSADLDPELPFIRGDIRLVARVLENLVENALRHTPAGGSVTLKLHPERGKVRVEVRDTGCGVAPEDLEHIFDRFYRGSTSDSGDSGAGLGLAIAKRIVELHGSTIEAESRVGEGTTIRFSL
jgi:signal transduction histidine kinase